MMCEIVVARDRGSKIVIAALLAGRHGASDPPECCPSRPSAAGPGAARGDGSGIGRRQCERRRGFCYTAGPLQPTTADLPQRGLVDGASQCARGAPCSSLRNEPSGGVENLFLMLRTAERGIECRFCKSPLLPGEPARVHAALVVESQRCKRAPYHPDWSAAGELDDQVGHTHPLPRKDRQDMATWIPQHPVKRCVGEAIEDTILSDEKST